MRGAHAVGLALVLSATVSCSGGSTRDDTVTEEPGAVAQDVAVGADLVGCGDVGLQTITEGAHIEWFSPEQGWQRTNLAVPDGASVDDLTTAACVPVDGEEVIFFVHGVPAKSDSALFGAMTTDGDLLWSELGEDIAIESVRGEGVEVEIDVPQRKASYASLLTGERVASSDDWDGFPNLVLANGDVVVPEGAEMVLRRARPGPDVEFSVDRASPTDVVTRLGEALLFSTTQRGSDGTVTTVTLADPETGRTVWTHEVSEIPENALRLDVAGGALVDPDGGFVAVAAGGDTQLGSGFDVLDAETGKVLWSASEHPAWAGTDDLTSMEAVDAGHGQILLRAGAEDVEGIPILVDGRTGEQVDTGDSVVAAIVDSGYLLVEDGAVVAAPTTEFD